MLLKTHFVYISVTWKLHKFTWRRTLRSHCRNTYLKTYFHFYSFQNKEIDICFKTVLWNAVLTLLLVNQLTCLEFNLLYTDAVNWTTNYHRQDSRLNCIRNQVCPQVYTTLLAHFLPTLHSTNIVITSNFTSLVLFNI